ncbi:MAG: sigma-70 family RNA polymerase sigma factor [Elusimicrobiaceae bacterium]|nr:sigma-70 family RNA polymerase sigma factor [Elusimicrobiaceae bacterium]
MILHMEQEAPLDSTNEYFKQLGKITRTIDREENTRLWALAKKGNEEAKNKILENNLRLVVPTAKRFLRPGMELMDLVEEGNLGLLQAIDKFEPRKGYRFSTYAIYWIEQYIRRYIEEQSGSIKIPSHAWGNLKRWFRAWNELKEVNGRDPSLNEMAQELDLTARQVKSIIDTLSAAKGVDSLTTMVYAEDDMTLEDLISDDGKGNPHDMFQQRENHQSIKQSMADLDDRDRQILIMRYGLDDNEPKTLGEVADSLGLSRERVRQIEERAVRTLRREALKMGIMEIPDGDFRTRKLHSAMRPRAKTNILGEEKPQGALAKLLRKAKKSALGKKTKIPARKTKSVSKKAVSSRGKTVKKSATKKIVRKPQRSVSRRKKASRR